MDTRFDTLYDVAICGAGPVGMTTGLLLAARGLRVVVLERRSTTSDEPKAISIDDEALRTYQQAGVIDRILPIVVPGTGTRYYGLDDEPLFHGGAESAYRLGYPFKNPFAQPDLERVLAEALHTARNVTVRFDTEVTSIVQDADAVAIEAGGRTVRARYLLGCDGGRSTVRNLLGIGMIGRSHPELWLVVDTLGDPHIERYGMHHADPSRPHVVVPGLGGRCRYEFRLFEGEGTATDAPPFELIEKLVSRYRPITPAQVERAVNYRFHGLVADRWQLGRCFLLGDAAHMMPPFAGQGLNSGIRDAANLTWKLAGALDGCLHESVLATYQSERGPHAAAVVRASERLGRVVMTTNPRIAARRDELVRAALATENGRRWFETMAYRPPYRFADGLVLPGDDTGSVIGQPRAFDSATRTIRPLDEILGTGWALVGVDVHDTAEWAHARDIGRGLHAVEVAVPTDRTVPRIDGINVLLDVDGGLDDEMRTYTGRFVLIRPDRFVAAAWHPHDGDDVRAAVRAAVASWIGTSASPSELSYIETKGISYA
ncbi:MULTISPECIES: FAD-dependent monooxygenase [unclassified Rhodococcus (in: high G+C Gram-positive bacteria)]|uniref:FAD-dependent monooxygenase n=1 Tax=unclassified Rhodococcus (in: high G+C Gram-positive bacteria) TaxID=192944 RepID=UPI0020CBD6D2|nr:MULTISPECIES: FAD-dependent monooxygenase [unclassified Rhodococcus (in: high G+C Gram-positive bacteria)]